jgi:phosphoribosyl-ATP pyrophosphohydrolase
LPRRKPDSVRTVRHELGSFEREQLADLKLVGLGIAVIPAALIGGALVLAYWIADKTWDEMQDWVRGARGMVGDTLVNLADEETIAAAMNASGNVAALGTLPTSLEGLSPFGCYEAVKAIEDAVGGTAKNVWIASGSLEDSRTNQEIFQRATDAIYHPFPRMNHQDFNYQMMLRETAARRKYAAVGSLGLTWATSGVLGAVSGSWTSTDPTDAPGYSADPLLDLNALRMDWTDVGKFSSVGSSPTLWTGADAAIKAGAAREELVLSWPGSDPATWRPPTVNWPPVELTLEEDPDFIGPPETPPPPVDYGPEQSQPEDDAQYPEDEDPDAQDVPQGPPR